MKINTKIRYGLRTMIEIASHNQNEGVLQKDIAQNQQISEKYLDTIIASLKASDLIINHGGKKRGYILNKPQSVITVYDIYRAFEQIPAITHCISNPSSCNRVEICVTREYWMGLNNIIIEYLKKTTLEHLTKRYVELNNKKKNPLIDLLNLIL